MGVDSESVEESQPVEESQQEEAPQHLELEFPESPPVAFPDGSQPAAPLDESQPVEETYMAHGVSTTPSDPSTLETLPLPAFADAPAEIFGEASPDPTVDELDARIQQLQHFGCKYPCSLNHDILRIPQSTM